jgi:hypothetical protein
MPFNDGLKLIKILILTVLTSACEGEKDNEGSTETLSNVSGQYAMITSAISVECSDGETDTLPALAIYGSVVQIGSKVMFRNDNEGPLVGITIIEGDSMDGIIQPGGQFVLTSSILATVEGINGKLTIYYNLSGHFNDTGWS